MNRSVTNETVNGVIAHIQKLTYLSDRKEITIFQEVAYLERINDKLGHLPLGLKEEGGTAHLG